MFLNRMLLRSQRISATRQCFFSNTPKDKADLKNLILKDIENSPLNFKAQKSNLLPYVIAGVGTVGLMGMAAEVNKNTPVLDKPFPFPR